MSITLPIKNTIKKPSTLNGLTNGYLPSDRLAYVGVGNAVMEYTAARAFRALFHDARLNGFDIKEVGDYRSYNEQLTLFLSRYRPVSQGEYNAAPATRRKYWAAGPNLGYKSAYWILHTGATAAVPGTSNHGLGLAIDIAEELDGDPGPESISTRFVQWLCVRARVYGIWASLQSEPWHWQYTEGDAIPQAVLDYEKGTPPMPPTPPTNPTPPVIPNPSPIGKAIMVTVNTVELRKGSSGTEVVRLQELLNELAGQNLVVDGQFGSGTEQAVRNWQGFVMRLNPTDGICGPKTWQSIMEVWLKV